MGQIIQFPTPEGAKVPSITRTPELALVLGILAALPAATKCKAMRQVIACCALADDCEASREAAHIAAKILGEA
ncbi:hypothetical protein [Novosphingobium aquae]|uniref:DUF982 domain-containing protein n=1 Tax=Novosphingobium aquae TaxID=3133435 RepID=A0ABU8S857_9SPHN